MIACNNQHHQKEVTFAQAFLSSRSLYREESLKTSRYSIASLRISDLRGGIQLDLAGN